MHSIDRPSVLAHNHRDMSGDDAVDDDHDDDDEVVVDDDGDGDKICIL